MSFSAENGINLSFSNSEQRISKMESSGKKPYLHFLKCPHENCDIVSKKMQNDFDPIFKLASLFGITFSLPDRNGEVPVRMFGWKKMYDACINILAVISLITTVSVAHNFALSNAMMITYCIKCTGSLLIRFNMLTQCRRLPLLFEHLSQLLTDVSTSIYKSLKINICLQCLGILVINFTLLTLMHLNAFYESKIHNLTQLNIIGYNVSNNDAFNVLHFVCACYSINFAISIFTVAICILACINVHIILRRLISNFGSTLLENLKNNPTKEELTKNFVAFRRIICGVNQADEVLSFCTFFSYVTCISCFFYIVSSFLVNEQKIFSRPFFAAEHFSVFLFSNFIFLAITCSASKVATAVEDLKKSVNCMSEVVMKGNLPCDILLNFMILIDNIKCTNVGMTGWGMFTITRGFVLTTLGVMITYGMILFQFG